MSDRGRCPIIGGVGLTEPIGSLKAGPGLQQVWLRGDRSCSLSVEVASVEAVATTCGSVEEVSTGSAAHFLFPAEGRSGWAYAGAAVGDAYVRVVRAKAVRAPPVTAGGDISAQCATQLAPRLPSPSRGGYRPGPLPPPTRSGDPLSPASPAGGP